MPSKGSVKVGNFVVQQGSARGATGVVDEYVNGPQGLGCRRKGRGKHVGVLQVKHQRLMASAAQVPQCFAQRRESVTVSGTNGDVSAGLRQHFGRRLTDAFARSAHEGVLSLKRCGSKRVVAVEEVHVNRNLPWVIALGFGCQAKGTI